MWESDLCGIIGDSSNGGGVCVWCLCIKSDWWCPSCMSGHTVVGCLHRIIAFDSGRAIVDK